MTKEALNEMYAGKIAFYTINELTFPVRIEAAYYAWTKIRFTIVPVGGSGRLNTKFENITFTPPAVTIRAPKVEEPAAPAEEAKVS